MMKMPQRFIIVDDDALSNMIGQQLIRKVCGEVDVQLFMEPLKALSYIQESYYDTENHTSSILFLDINISDMTGWEFLEKFEEHCSHAHKQFTIYMLSSSDDKRDQELTDSNRLVSGMLTKPLDKNILQYVIAGL